MSLLFYDSSSSTHLYEFVEYLVSFLDRKKNNSKVYFLLNGDVINRVNSSIDSLAFGPSFENIIFVSIPIFKIERFSNCRNLVYQSFLEEDYVNIYCKENFIQEVCFLNLDLFQLILGFNFLRSSRKYTISGILFSPYTFYPKYLHLLRFRKRIQIFVLLRNKCIKNIFILNDEDSVKLLNINHNTSVFSLLPDPLKKRSFNLIDFRFRLGIDSNDFVFLSLGGFSYRKNLLNIIQAFKNLPNAFLKNKKLIIAGQVHDLEYFQKVKVACGENLQKNIFLISDFLSFDEIESLISQANVVLALYIDFYSSSGVVGNAAKFCKPVLGSNEGVIGKIISDFKLGVSTNPNSIRDISNSFMFLVDNYNSIIYNSRFSEYNDRNDFIKFSETIFCRSYFIS